MEEGYLKIAANSFARKKAGEETESKGSGDAGEDEVSCDAHLLEALQKLKKNDILSVKNLSIKEGRLPRQSATIPVP